jgi:hypothetical protein
MEKDQVIIELIEALRTALGKDQFVIADHWEADTASIGIASPHNHQVLAYISTFGESPGKFSLELEAPLTDPCTDSEYEVAGSHESIDFEALTEIVRIHFQTA